MNDMTKNKDIYLSSVSQRLVEQLFFGMSDASAPHVIISSHRYPTYLSTLKSECQISRNSNFEPGTFQTPIIK